jgi:hypothetical protein
VPQQVVPAFPQNGVEPVVQHVCPALQEALPQQLWPALMQYLEPLVPVQQVCPALQEILPQQNPPEFEQNVEPLELVQQVCPALHELLPQQLWPAFIQYFKPFVPVQQVCPALQEPLPQQNPPEPVQYLEPVVPVQQVCPALQDEVPQHNFPAAIQKLPAQQVCPGEHFGEQLCASACLTVTAPKAAPASTPMRRFSASRRGIGLARMRAASSIMWLILEIGFLKFDLILQRDQMS